MKINELIQTGTRIEEYEVVIPAVLDSEGNVIAEEHTETCIREVPVMASITRDMTPEEEAEMSFPQQPLPSYAELVEMYVREQYTVSDELAILRQRDTKADEFETYSAYCESCKTRARQKLGLPVT